MKSNIRIISDLPAPKDGLVITESDEQGYSLIYGSGEEILGESDPRKPIHLSSLKLRLQQRSWNTPLRKHIGPNGELRMRMSESEDPIDILSDLSVGIPCSSTDNIGTSRLDNIKAEMEKNNIYLYDISRSTIDLLENTVTYNIIDYSSDVYTNTVSLGEVSVGLVYPGCRGSVELSIQYSKSGKVYNHDTVFKTLIWGETVENFTEPIGSDVVIEYANNVIRVIPVSADVDECIISNCVLTYGNI